jgi:uncharacterized phage protein (TIGR01671 family)
MRPIKFRAWDGMEMWDVETMEELHDPSNQVMQFTGLLGKNGKEIYEGDVVRWKANYRMQGKEGVSQVVWRHTGLDIEASDFGYEGENIIGWEDLEVIGNIYENPELLKKV